MNIDNLEKIVRDNLKNRTNEIRRVFHGRGNFYDGFNFLTVDSIDKILFASFFEGNDLEINIIKSLEIIAKELGFETFVVQKRYQDKSSCKTIFGKIEDEEIVIENGLKYLINFSNKNIGIFPDMKIGREFVKNNSKDKNVLNLFSYTCAFSVCAVIGEAKKIVNMDMSKNALNIGRKNHHLNNCDTKKVKFLPHNILKSWNKLKKEGPYDLIIIDPPSFQKGSFAATKDYEKIIKRLDDLASENCTILSCLNAPELDTKFILELFEKNASNFLFQKRLENLDSFPTSNSEKTLKNLIFKKILN